MRRYIRVSVENNMHGTFVIVVLITNVHIIISKSRQYDDDLMIVTIITIREGEEVSVEVGKPEKEERTKDAGTLEM